MEEEKQTQKELIHDLNSKGEKSIFSSGEKKEKTVSMRKPLIITIVIALILGIGTGFVATKTSGVNKKGPLSINDSSTSNGTGSLSPSRLLITDPLASGKGVASTLPSPISAEPAAWTLSLLAKTACTCTIMKA